MTACDFDCWERGRDCDHGPDIRLDEGPGLEWDWPEPDEAPPSRRVVSIETTGDRL